MEISALSCVFFLYVVIDHDDVVTVVVYKKGGKLFCRRYGSGINWEAAKKQQQKKKTLVLAYSINAQIY